MSDDDLGVLEAAHFYRKRGWGVVPLHGWNRDTGFCRCSAGRFCPEKNRGKHPVMGAWQKKALTSAADVHAWFEDNPTNNVGILTGPESGIFVFDVDGAAGVRSVTQFATEFGPLPATRIVRTGSGGLHYFFRHPKTFRVHGSTSLLAPGIDIRGVGGQVVAPPSVSGRGPYEVISDHPVAEAPDWLLDRLREHTQRVEGGHKAEARGAEPVDVALMPERVRTMASTLIAEDEGRFQHFHGLVAACHEAGFTQGQTVTIVAPWCAAVDKFVGRVEAEVARSWGKIQAAAEKEAEWLGSAAATTTQADPSPTPTTQPDQPHTNDDAADPALETAPELPATWRPVDLTSILSGTYLPEKPALYPRSDGHHLVYPGRVHSFHGESESGKSLVVQAESARLIKAGQDVLYIDFESDAAAVIGRMRDLGCPNDLIQLHFTYVRPDNDPRRFPHERTEYSALLGNTYALAVIDGMTDALGAFGASTTDNDEISDFMRAFPRLLARRTGAAVIVIDHVTKDADSRGRFALGGQAKMNALDGSAFVVEIVDPLGRGLHGSVTLRVAKDRPGGVRPYAGAFRKTDRTQEAARVFIDSTGDGIEVTVQAPMVTVENGAGERKEFRPTGKMQRISEFLANAVSPQSQKVIEDAIPGKAAALRQALSLLIAEGFVEVEPGPRGSHLHNLLKPYEEAQDPASDTYVGWAQQGPETSPRPTSSHLVPTSSPEGAATSSLPPPPLRGRDEVSGVQDDVTSSPARPLREKPAATVLEVGCKRCFSPTPETSASVLDGLCAKCARETGVVA